MIARFHVSGSFHLESASAFILHGAAVQGAVAPGMIAILPRDPGQSVAVPIQSVEVVDFRAERRADTALLFECAGAWDRAFWDGLQLVGRTIVISDSDRAG